MTAAAAAPEVASSGPGTYAYVMNRHDDDAWPGAFLPRRCFCLCTPPCVPTARLFLLLCNSFTFFFSHLSLALNTRLFLTFWAYAFVVIARSDP